MRVNALAGSLASMSLAAASTLALVSSFTVPRFYPTRFGVTVAVLLMLHSLRYQRLFLCRELLLYAILAAYLVLSLLWTPDVVLGFTTLVPTQGFHLVLLP